MCIADQPSDSFRLLNRMKGTSSGLCDLMCWLEYEQVISIERSEHVCECSVSCLSGVFCMQYTRWLRFGLDLHSHLGWLHQSTTLSLLVTKVPQTGAMGPVWCQNWWRNQKSRWKKFTRTNWNHNGLNICIKLVFMGFHPHF
jgi:hypothetical protein